MQFKWSRNEALGEFEHLVLLAIVRLDTDAYGSTIRREIEEQTGRSIAIGALYTALDRLERKGYVSSRLSDPTPQRGGRAKRYFQLRPAGATALDAIAGGPDSNVGRRRSRRREGRPMIRPSRLALWLHERSLAADEREAVIGDVVEEFARRAAHQSTRRAPLAVGADLPLARPKSPSPSECIDADSTTLAPSHTGSVCSTVSPAMCVLRFG